MNRQTPTKQAIVDSAFHLFHLKGYHATSIRDIANKAKVMLLILPTISRISKGC